MTAPAHYSAGPAIRAAQDYSPPAWKAEHTAFGDIARQYAGQAGKFPGKAGQLARDAGTAIAEASAAAARAVTHAATVAADRNIYPDGRREQIRSFADALGTTAAGHLQRAENLLSVARAQLEVDALPKVPRSAEATARADAQMLLAGTAPRELSQRMSELARRDDAVGALIASEWGRDYLAGRGADPQWHNGVRAAALDAAATSADPQRSAAAEALGRLGHLDGALLAARLQARHAGNDLAAVAKTIG